jgi:hypothetical protein
MRHLLRHRSVFMCPYVPFTFPFVKSRFNGLYVPFSEATLVMSTRRVATIVAFRRTGRVIPKPERSEPVPKSGPPSSLEVQGRVGGTDQPACSRTEPVAGPQMATPLRAGPEANSGLGTRLLLHPSPLAPAALPPRRGRTLLPVARPGRGLTALPVQAEVVPG